MPSLATRGSNMQIDRSASRCRDQEMRGDARRHVWEEFCRDQELIRIFNIKPEEMDALKNAALLGDVRNKQGFVLVLSAIRRYRHR